MKSLKTILNKKIRPAAAIISAVKNIRDADRYMRIMFDNTPLSATLWDEDYNLIDCNLEAARMFGLADKALFMKKFLMYSPEYQPCGRPSADMVVECIERAFIEGYNRFEWQHQTEDGGPLPCEIIAMRVEHKGKPIVAAYKRDLREIKATIAAMQKTEGDLRMALIAAEDSAKAKSEFLNNMNHELRTPLNGVLGFLRMATQTNQLEKQRGYIAEAEKSASSLLKLVSDVLDFTEIENQKMKASSEIFKLQDVIDRIERAYAPAAKNKNLELNIRLPGDIPEQLTGDPYKLQNILSNLIDNAVKFTDKGKITVRANVKRINGGGVEIRFYVRDTGMGIKPDHIKTIFEPFWQGDASLTRKHGGTGFGLSLSKHLAHLLGGKIWVESEYEEGSTFYFTARFGLTDGVSYEKTVSHETDYEDNLSYEPDPAGDGWERETDIAVVSPAAPDFNLEKPAPVNLSNPPGDGDAPNPVNAHLLVVDDVEINQIIAEELLTGIGYTVDVAGNGQEAIDMIRQKDYDAVLMDIQMPVMDGLTAAVKIRESERHRHLPIIAVSAHAMDEDVEKSLAHGMNDHITKPFDLELLAATLNKWLRPMYGAYVFRGGPF